MKIGVVGLGRMGMAACKRFIESGQPVVGWDVNLSLAHDLEELGGVFAASPSKVVESCDAVISFVTGDEAARWLFEDENGLLASDVKGKLFIESSTLQPSTIAALGERVQAAGANIVGCPVIGTIPQVLQGELLVLAGGTPQNVERAKEALRPLTRELVHLGPLGAGNVMKLVLNLTMASYLEALAEGLALGAEYGFELNQMLDLLAQSPTANPWLAAKRETLAGGSGPVSLDLAAIHKDVLYAVAAGSAAGVSMPMASGMLSSLSAAVATGHGQDDLATLPRIFRKTMVRSAGKPG